MQENKDKKQVEFANVYLSLKQRRGTIISATGTGKSRIAMLILNQIEKDYDHIYISVNANRLRDVTWKEELAKWKEYKLLNKITLVNYQTAYRWNPNDKDYSKCFFVCDEVDFAIGTEEYGKFFYKFKDVDTLALTGYVAEYKREELNKILPIVVNYTRKEAEEEGIINKVKLIFVKYDLDKDKTAIKVEYTDKLSKERKHFFQSENSAYDYADKEYRKAYGNYNRALLNSAIGVSTKAEVAKYDYQQKRLARQRANILYNCIASRNVAIKLKNSILEKESNKVMIFSKLTDQCNLISDHTYHYKNPEELNTLNLTAFNNGDIRAIGVCSKVNRGDNLNGLNYSILESFDSSDTIIEQRMGRNSRLKVDEVAYIYVLIPYFMRKTTTGYNQAPTQALTWVNNMLYGYDTSNVEIIDLRSIKSEI